MLPPERQITIKFFCSMFSFLLNFGFFFRISFYWLCFNQKFYFFLFCWFFKNSVYKNRVFVLITFRSEAFVLIWLVCPEMELHLRISSLFFLNCNENRKLEFPFSVFVMFFSFNLVVCQFKTSIFLPFCFLMFWYNLLNNIFSIFF